MTQNTNTDDDDIDSTADRQEKVREAIEANVADIVLSDQFKSDDRSLSARDNGPCHRCENQRDVLNQLTVDGKTRYICDDCATEIVAEVDNHYWFDRFQQGHYDVIAAFLDSLEEVWCVHDHAYQGGELFVHTGYLTCAVVSDVLDFVGSVYSVNVERADDSCWDCVEEHGDCVEILIDFGDGSVPLNPLSPAELAEALSTRSTYDVDLVDEDDRIFEHDGR